MSTCCTEQQPDSTAIDIDPEVQHIVCHCTDYNVAACRKPVVDEPWTDLPDSDTCALCLLGWPDGSPACPWGCSCDECGPEAVA